MRLRGRLGASLALLLALAATVGLFYYAQQFRKASVLSLQAKLQTLQLQRLEEDRGGQVVAAAQKSADDFNKFLDKIQKRAEALSDLPVLRQPHVKAAARKFKEREFLRLAHQDPNWVQALLVDESGSPIASFGTGAPANLSASPEFREVFRQRMTLLRLDERKGQDPLLQVTVPCLGQTGEFLGATQLSVVLSSQVLESVWAQPGLVSLLGTVSGRRLSAVTLPNFPNHLGALMNKEPSAFEASLTAGGPHFFKAEWNNKHYLIGSAEVRLSSDAIYTLLEVGGLERLVGSEGASASEPFWTDPIMVVGLALILVIGWLLLLWLAVPGARTSGSGGLVSELQTRVAAEIADPTPLAPENFPGVAADLLEVINALLARPTPVSGGEGSSHVEQQRRWAQEVSELRQARERILADKQTLQEKLEGLTLENERLREANVPPPAAPVTDTQDASSQLRIDAIVNMSEDLKATLTVIRNYISSILSSEEGKITDAQQEFLGVVINKSARLERQINDLLDLSHLETEARQMFMVPTDLGAMLQDVLLNSQPQADTKQIRLTTTSPANLSKIMANSDRLGQVLVNLVQHSLRVTPVGGEVRLEVEENAGSETIKIIDTAPPMDAAQAADMFNRFHGQDSPAGPTLVGTGLRFAIIHLIVAAHHGRIEVHGLGEQGNELRIDLPFGAEEKPGAGGAAPQPARGTQEPTGPVSAPSGTETNFDLSTFIQGSAETGVPGGGEDLDELLKNIETINGQPEK
jgi:signal transduction histidine kinase